MKSKRWLIFCASCLWAASCAQGGPQRSVADRKVGELVKEGKYEQALVVLDQMQFRALKAGRFQEDLELSMQIEELSQKTSQRQSPWNCLKIAEAYLGLGDRASGLKWLEQSVHERDFMNLEVLSGPPFNALKDEPGYQALMAAAKMKIGLDREAKDFQVTLLDGSDFRLADQRGKVVLVDFWDVKCPPCRKEMPHLKEMIGELRDRGLEIIGISLDTDKKLLADFLKEAALPWKMACSYKGWGDDTAKLYKISATPSTWLIDRRGILRHYNLRGEKLKQAVRELLKE